MRAGFDGSLQSANQLCVSAAALIVRDPQAEQLYPRSDARTALAVAHGRADDARHMGAVTDGIVQSQRGIFVEYLYPRHIRQILMICHYAAVQNGHRHPLAGGDAPGGVAVHGVVHVLIASGSGVLKKGIRVSGVVQPAPPGLGLGNVVGEQGNARIFRPFRLIRRQHSNVIGIGRGEPVGFLGGGQSLHHGNAVQPQRGKAVLSADQLRRKGLGIGLGGFLGICPHQKDARLILRPFRQGSGLLGHLMGNHVRLIRQLLVAENVVLRKTGQVVGKRLRLGFGGGLRNRLPGSLSSGLTGGFGNRFLRDCRGGLRRGLRDGFLGGLGRFRSRRLCCGFRNLDGFHRFGADGGGLRRLLRQCGLGQCAHCQHRRQQDGNDPLSIFHRECSPFLNFRR